MVSEFGKSLLNKAPAIAVSATIFQSLSDRDRPSGIGAIVEKSVHQLLPLSDDGLYVALFDISDPGNVGTIIRTADAAGANGIILVGETVDATHPAVIKASMGAFFAMPLSCMSEGEFEAWAADIRKVATSAKGTVDYCTADYTTPLVIMMGNEREGLTNKWINASQQLITIPMHGISSSLNVAIATGILLYRAKIR